MSKRIIYLLSLLMALSLVFAGCKKSSGIMGPEPSSEINNSPGTTNGLVEDNTWLDENSEKPISNNEIPYFQTKAGDSYIRNPVIVVMGANKSDVVVFAEKRYKSSGSKNDIGIDGKTPADIVYISSTNSGKSWGLPQIAGRTAAAQADGKDAVASPVVFKISDTEVVVVASAGAGLSRSSSSYSGREPKSQLRYTIGTYDKGTFKWNKEWADDNMTTKVAQAVQNVTVLNDTVTYSYQQFGTLAARGFVTNDNSATTLYLAVTLVDQGNTKTPKNAMGNVMVKGTYNTTSVDWEVINNTAIGFKTIRNDNGNSAYKESVAIGFESSKGVYYLTTGASYYYGDVNMGEGYQNEQPTADGRIPGSEGSFSYLEVSKWYGSISYDPAKYGQDGSAAINGSMPRKQRLFAHVRGLNNTIAMYALDDNLFKQKASTKYYTVVGYPTENTTLAKSSSMDILGDGTIVMVAEQGGKEREYNIVFKRFTQQFLAAKLGMDAEI